MFQEILRCGGIGDKKHYFLGTALYLRQKSKIETDFCDDPKYSRNFRSTYDQWEKKRLSRI